MRLFEEKAVKTTPISVLGEFALIEYLTKDIKIKNKSSIKGVGDDAAVIDIGDRFHLLSTDLLVEGVHFDLAYTPLKHLGYKAVAVNVSDICAMNAVAKQMTVGLALSNRFSVEALEELYAGINLACKKYNVDLVGGDTTSSTSGLMISISVLGEVAKDNITYRNGAKGNDYVLKRQLRPEARVDIIKKLREFKIRPTSMIDISDGLSSEALHLSKTADVGIQIYEDKIPLDITAINLSQELNLNPVLCALNGGEDYELLLSINQKEYEKLKADVDFSIIGHITDKSEGNNFIAKDGSSNPLTAQGWDATKTD